jgi:DNA-binding CsgD family transcriptional regulator
MALRDVGFTPVQEEVYRALVGNPEVVPPGADQTVRELVALGVLRRDPGSPSGVRVPNPSVALGELIERVEDELVRRQRLVGYTRCEIAALTAEHAGRRTAPDGFGVEWLTDSGAVLERLDELSFFTRSSVFAVQPLSPADRSRPIDPARLDVRILRRGLDMRVIYDGRLLANTGAVAQLQRLATAGVAMRFTREPPDRMIIMDESVAVLPVDPADSGRGAVVVRQEGLLRGLVRLFHHLWAAAETAADALDDEDRRVLNLLADGKTDETAARAVGMSVRHLRRRIARLMDVLQATSRFQAGAVAARKGWI